MEVHSVTGAPPPYMRTHADNADLTCVCPLTDAQRERLVAAMAEVERLLVASMVTVGSSDPRHPDARSCLRACFGELGRRFDRGFDPELSSPVADAEMSPPAGLFLVALLPGEPVGCGALRFHEKELETGA